MNKVIISGDRNWDDDELRTKMRNVLRKVDNGTEIIHGGCKGVDKVAGEIAKELSISCVVFSADWNKYGKAAGPVRNKQMLDYGAGIVIAFHKNISESKGTKDMMKQAEKRGIKVFLIS